MPDPFSDRTDADFQQEMLTRINAYRASHGAPPLTLAPELVEYAKSRAAGMAAHGGLSHAGLQSGYGENASWQATSSGPAAGPAVGATKSWYDEVLHYDFSQPEGPHSGTTGHFTALVWKSTTKLGVGRVSGQGPKWWETYIVANFAPAGNMSGAFADNVAAPAQV